MSRWLRPIVVAAAALAVVPATALSYGKKDSDYGKKGYGKEDTARYILPPGNFGGLPTNADSLDQLPLYDSLTPLRDNVTKADIENKFLPENFQPIGADP